MENTENKSEIKDFEDLPKIKMLRGLAGIEEEDKEEWKVTRSVISDIHKKILWAKYGWEMARDTSYIDEILSDILLQVCWNEKEHNIDTQCLGPFEEACDYLAKKGYLKTSNKRIYTLVKR